MGGGPGGNTAKEFSSRDEELNELLCTAGVPNSGCLTEPFLSSWFIQRL